MTATATKPSPLHEFEGRTVHRATVKIVGAGDGLSDALDIEPEEIELEEDRYYVIKTRCGRVSIEVDKNGINSRVHTMKTFGISKIEPKLAEGVLQKEAERVSRAKAEIEGQLSLDAEAEAAERESHDGDGTPPGEIAADAADRVRDGR